MDFAHVKAIAERALADGMLTSEENDEIEAAIYADGIVSPEELALLEAIGQKVRDGEIQLVGPNGEVF